ncbi:MAG: universal stress protein [Granulosicoccaceae bacterium]
MYNTILVPTDGSVCSQQAIDHALRLAKLCGSSVHFLYVTQPSYAVGMAEVDGFVSYPDPIDEDIVELGQQALDAAVASATAAGVEASQELSEGGAAAQVISTAADKRDLVVMGGHGRSGLARVLLGSVCEAVIRHVHVPVLVVHCSDED